MKRRLAWSVVAVLAAAAASAEDPAQALARGKLEADLGHHAVAADAFESVAQAPEATVPQRWEALVRLGVARRDAGDAGGSVDALEEAYRTYGKDPEALRFLLFAAGHAVPGRARWDAIWSQVRLEVDRRNPESPRVRVTWPGHPFSLCRCSGTPDCPCSGTRISLHFVDDDLQDIFRLFADVTGLNVVVHPGVQGKVDLNAREVPWDEMLDRILAANGYVARVDGNVLEIGPPAKFGEKRSFRGAAISFDYQNKDLVEALREVAAHAHATVEVAEGVKGRVFFKLDNVPWDQAFDLLVRLFGLAWTRAGDVIRVELARRAPSR